MTTNIRRMFGNLLTTSKFLKVMSAVLVACMLISLTACGTATQQNATQTTTQYEEEEHINEQAIQDPPAENPDSGHWHDEEPSSTEQPINPTEEPSSTEDPVDNPPTGMYSYTVYGDIQLFMDVNIDDYITTNSSGQEIFQLTRLALDLGWWPNDVDPATFGGTTAGWSSQYSGSPSNFTYHTSTGEVIVLDIDDISDHDSRYDYNQIGFISYTFNSNRNPESPLPMEDRDIVIYFNNHYDNVQYMTPLYKSVMSSRDDIIIIAYLMSRVSGNPLENSNFVAAFERYENSSTFVTAEYRLP